MSIWNFSLKYTLYICTYYSYVSLRCQYWIEIYIGDIKRKAHANLESRRRLVLWKWVKSISIFCASHLFLIIFCINKHLAQQAWLYSVIMLVNVAFCAVPRTPNRQARVISCENSMAGLVIARPLNINTLLNRTDTHSTRRHNAWHETIWHTTWTRCDAIVATPTRHDNKWHCR